VTIALASSSSRLRRTGIVLLGAAALVTVMSGCSQIDTLKPVVGDEIVGVQIAIGEVLRSQPDLEVKTVPVCEADDDQFSCAGETLAGDEITGQTSGPDAQELTVAIAGRTIFKGTVQSVQDKAGRTAASPSPQTSGGSVLLPDSSEAGPSAAGDEGSQP